MRLRVAIVVATDEQGRIGAGGRIPWHVPDDLRRFRMLTLGKPVIVGRRTLEECIGRVLSGRENIVLSRQPGWSYPGAHVASSLDDALAMADELAPGSCAEACVIGGGEVYEEALPKCDVIYHTIMHMRSYGDKFFPRTDHASWPVIQSIYKPAGVDAAWPITYTMRERERD